jgi:hypothetical protein
MLAMTPVKYLLAIFIAASWYVVAFLKYPLPSLSFWLLGIWFACWIPLVFFSLSALFRRNWRAIAIFSATWLMALLSLFEPEPVKQVRDWIGLQGFRIHVASERYPSRCELVTFVEDGIEQQLGHCETITRSIDFLEDIFYDTTGQFALPPKQRTKGWQDAMYNFSPYCYLAEKAVADRGFGNFYTVVIPVEHLDGC